MAAMTFGDHVENRRISWPSPTQRKTYAPDLVCPEFNMQRMSESPSTDKSPSSNKIVGQNCSTARKIAAGVAWDVDNGRQHNLDSNSKSVVLPHRLSGLVIARIGDTRFIS
jgi:hypothetical protein